MVMQARRWSPRLDTRISQHQLLRYIRRLHSQNAGCQVSKKGDGKSRGKEKIIEKRGYLRSSSFMFEDDFIIFDMYDFVDHGQIAPVEHQWSHGILLSLGND